MKAAQLQDIFHPPAAASAVQKKKKKQFWKHLMLSVVSAVSPGRSFGSWYCQKKHPVITRDKTRKNTKPSWVHFTFILLVFVSPSNLTVAAGAGAAAAGDGLNTNTQQHTAGQQRKCAELLYTHTKKKFLIFTGSGQIFSSVPSVLMQRSRNPSQLGLRQMTLATLNSTHHLMLHRARAGWTGLPGTQKSSSHSINILNIYSELLLLCEWLLCSSKAVNGAPWRVSWAGERHRHGRPSLISHWLCCNPGPSALPSLTIQFPLLQPQAVDIIIPRFTPPKQPGKS